MKLTSIAPLALALCLGGCGLRTVGSDEPEIPDYVDTEVQSGPTSASDATAACSARGTAEIQALYDLTEDSVHEIITCGGIQMQVAASMKVMIFASNESLVSASARADIRDVIRAVGMTIDNPFTQEGDGTWTMAAGGAEGSTFGLSFYDPQTGELVRDDPFDLDTYVRGVTARSSHTWEEMKANPAQRATFTYEWTEEGPLAHLLADGGPIPNPIVVRMSLLELGGAALGLAAVDYGPFESAQDIEIESRIHMVDQREAVDVSYDVTGRRTRVRRLVDTSSLPFDVESMFSTDGTYSLQGNTDGLAFVGRGSLAGEIHYGVSGAGALLSVVSDFGGGMAYPTPRWQCE